MSLTHTPEQGFSIFEICTGLASERAFWLASAADWRKTWNDEYRAYQCETHALECEARIAWHADQIIWGC